MKVCGFKISQFVVTLAALASLAGTVSSEAASVLYSQPYDGFSPGTPSEVFTDLTTSSTKSFDDFVVTGGGWIVNSVTVFGMEQGTSADNVNVLLQFQKTAVPSYTDNTDPTYVGTENGSGNLLFTNLNVSLSPGTYWITAWVVRAFNPGGQWFWDETDVGNPIGSTAYIQNPGGALLNAGLMPAAVPGTQIFGPPPYDQAFTISGSVVPEPASVLPFSLGILGIAWVGCRRATL